MNYEFIYRIIVCFILSFIVGLERQWRRRTIGLRTNVLVSIGSFLFVTLSVSIPNTDASRIAAQVVSGIGFLGAGVILKDGEHVRGLNTAATLWCNAAIGVLCSFGLIFEATIGMAFILLSNVILRYVGFQIMKKNNDNKTEYILKIICDEDNYQSIKTMTIKEINKEKIRISKMEVMSIEKNKTRLLFEIDVKNKSSLEQIVSQFSLEPSISSISFKYKSEDLLKALEEDEV